METIYVIAVRARGPKADEKVQQALDRLNTPDRGFVATAFDITAPLLGVAPGSVIPKPKVPAS